MVNSLINLGFHKYAGLFSFLKRSPVAKLPTPRSGMERRVVNLGITGRKNIDPVSKRVLGEMYAKKGVITPEAAQPYVGNIRLHGADRRARY